MADYVFQQKINTVAQTREPFEHNGYEFQAFRMDWKSGSQNGWAVSKEVAAENVDAAFQAFFSELYPLVDMISFITCCPSSDNLRQMAGRLKGGSGSPG